MRFRGLLTVVALGFGALGAAAPAAGASFDCAAARGADARAVCADRRLSERDVEMNALWFSYRLAPMLMGANGERTDEEHRFLRERAACDADRACLGRVYRLRIAALKGGIENQWTRALRDENAPAPPVDGVLPPVIAAIAAGYADQCRLLGGTLAPGPSRPLAMTADIDGDGRPDYVIDPQNLRCTAAATAFCGNGGCQIQIVLSRDGWRHPVSAMGGEPTLVEGENGARLELWVGRENCGLTDRSKACRAIYAWGAGKLITRYEARPAP
ncbi:MAG: hypothetical protein ABI376_07560 [Caulobacteraceae bacterium]